MGGLDLTDLLVYTTQDRIIGGKSFLLYDVCEMFHTLYDDMKYTKALLPFLVTVAEDLITLGRSYVNLNRKSANFQGYLV